jgi:hypothetical protein
MTDKPIHTVNDLKRATGIVPIGTPIMAHAGNDSSVTLYFRDGKDWREFAYFAPEGDDA